MKVLDLTALSLFVWTLIALPFFLLNWFSYLYRCYSKRGTLSCLSGPNKPPIKSTRAFLIPILTFFVVCFLSVSNAREQVRYKINSLRPRYTLSVNGAVVQNSRDVLRALNDLHRELGHHSHFTKKIDVVICDQSDHIALILERDSERPEEDWVFLPKYWITLRTEIGRIKTSAFDNY
jgi:hypothetical protein